MIVEMAKVTIIAAKSHIEEALVKLRRFGLVHIKYINPPEDKSIIALNKELQSVEKSISIVRDRKSSKAEGTRPLSSVAGDIISLEEDRDKLVRQKNSLESKLSWFYKWGMVSLQDIKELEEWGIFFKFYILNRKQLNTVLKNNTAFILKEEKGKFYTALVFQKADETLFAQEECIPDAGYDVLKEDIDRINAEIKSIDSRLDYLAGYKEALDEYRNAVEKKIEFYRVRSGMAKEDEFWYLQGFIPRDGVSRLKQIADKEGWGVVVQEPDNYNEVPTLIRNPRWVRIIEPVFKLIGTVPGYAEYDISIWFLIFLTLFFAMLIGDAGYGLLFLISTFLARRKLKNLPGEPFSLMYVFSAATIIWGAVTGTWFGVEKIAHLPILKDFVVERVNSFVDANQMFMMYICFFIGAVHLTIAHSMVLFRKRKSLTALAQAGWILIVWGLFFLAGTLVMGKVFPELGGWLFIAGTALVVLFSSPQKNMIKAIAVSLGDIPLKFISSFSDIVSYIRLFAVGYATVVLAVNFNNMAVSMGFSNFIRGFGSALILFIGHSLNIVLGFMAIIVHGVRLNMLEFSGHLGMEWSGTPYMPFKE